MILSKDSNNNWTPTAGGNGTFIGTLAAFNAVKNTLPDNTVAYITDDGAGIADVVADGNMNPVTSNAVYESINSITSGTASLYDNATAEATVKWYKQGRFVSVIIDALTIRSVPSFLYPFCTGLPEPVQMGWVNIGLSGSNAGKCLTFQVSSENNQGVLKFDFGVDLLEVNSRGWGTFTYFTKS